MEDVKQIQRKQATVVKLLVEVNHALYERLENYCTLYNQSKRDIVSDALLQWLNAQDSFKPNNDTSNVDGR
jgi:hypothetical protein